VSRTTHEVLLDKLMAFADQQDERYTSKVIIIVVPREEETCPVGGQVGYAATEDGCEQLLKDVVHAMDHYAKQYGFDVRGAEMRQGPIPIPLNVLMEYLMSRRGGPFEL
jgi:hypothetical protein